MDDLLHPFVLDDRMPALGAPIFDGFAFSGADAIIGPDGLSDWESANGALPVFSDGCYILARPDDDGVVIGTDAAGYRHLFYWQGKDGGWAVGESYLGLVAHLRARSVPLVEDKAQSGAWLSRRQLFQQITTRKTAVRGIRLLGRDEILRAEGGALTVTRHPRPVADSYEGALRNFLETWLSRCLTLHAVPDLRLFFHLSGGVDSRAVAAFRIHLERRFGPMPHATFRSIDDDSHRDDLRISRRIAQTTDLPLNALDRRPDLRRSPDETLARWERDAVGVYAPLRLTTAPSDPRDIGFSGHGGGGYKQPMSRRQFAAVRRAMWWAYGWYGRWLDMGARRRFMADLDAEFLHLGALSDNPGQVWNHFARASRARFHGGQAATYKTQVAIFDSRLAETAADSRSAASQLPLQFHHDIIASLAPDLLNLPYDDRRKAPTAANRAALTVLADLKVEPGRCYGAFEVPQNDPAEESGDPYKLLVERIADRQALLPKGRVNRRFMSDVAIVDAQIRAGKRPHPVRMRNLHNAWLLVRLAELGVKPDG